MKYNFDVNIDRKNSQSFKWDKNMEFFNREDILPMWVADMDFTCADPIIEALKTRIEHPILGYSIRTQSHLDSIVNWFKRKYDYKVNKDYLTFSPPGVIYAIYVLLQILTEKGDSVIMQEPNYNALFQVVIGTDRKLVINKMKYENKKYFIDYNDLESKMKAGAKVLIITNPNNPVGKSLTRDELEKIGNLSLKYGVFVIVDEIYSDFVFNGKKHIPFGSISECFSNNCMMCYSGNKGFNLGGLHMATVVIPNGDIREKYDNIMNISQTRLDNLFGSIALETAYTKCDDWLEQVKDYVYKNRKYAIDYINKNISQLKVIESDATFLLWIDCNGLLMNEKELEIFMINKVKIGFSQGYEFGKSGNGFIRMNIGCPMDTLKEALNRLDYAISNIK